MASDILNIKLLYKKYVIILIDKVGIKYDI